MKSASLDVAARDLRINPDVINASKDALSGGSRPEFSTVSSSAGSCSSGRTASSLLDMGESSSGYSGNDEAGSSLSDEEFCPSSCSGACSSSEDEGGSSEFSEDEESGITFSSSPDTTGCKLTSGSNAKELESVVTSIITASSVARKRRGAILPCCFIISSFLRSNCGGRMT